MGRVQKCMKSFGIMTISVLSGVQVPREPQPPKTRD